MSGQNAAGYRTFEADEAIAQYLRVKLDSDGKVTIAGAANQDIGVASREAFAAGDAIAVDLVNRGGSHYAVASEAIAVGAKVYGAAGGKVGDTQATGAFLRGIAVDAATADGDIIEIIPLVGDTAGA